ncbi:hypothetical protein CFP56_040949 [Quercus suber]|uniref:Uncharacterized protein n=1 Tax=Quercus suber TaxID=58331 RepID=A0AAW0IWS7_QUESU
MLTSYINGWLRQTKVTRDYFLEVKLCRNSFIEAMIFASSSDLKLIGLRIKNSPKFHFGFDQIHLEKTNNVKIYNSFISTGILFCKLSIPSSCLPYVFTIIKAHIVWAYTSYAGDDCMSIGNNSHNVDIRNLTFSQICGTFTA